VTAEGKAAAAKRSAGQADVAPVGFFQAFMLPNVISYAAAFGFFKLVKRFLLDIIFELVSYYYCCCCCCYCCCYR
jgi:hypothetical protein